MSGVAIPGAIFGGVGINIKSTGGRILIELGETTEVSSASFDNIGSEIVARYPIPEDTTVSVMVNLTARLFRDAATSTAGASASYTFIAAARRVLDGAAAEVAAETVVSTLEEASGTLPADWSASVSVDGNDLVVAFTIANNSYAEGTDPNIGLSAKFIPLGIVATEVFAP